MFTAIIDTKAAQQIPTSLKEWKHASGHGPHMAVAKLVEAGEKAVVEKSSPVYTLKGWEHQMGAHAHALALGYC